MLANCGIQRVIFAEAYPDPLAVGILTTAGVKMFTWDAAKKAVVPLKGNSFEQAQDELRRKWKAGEFHATPSPGAVLGGKLPMAGEAPRPAPPRFEEVPEDLGPGQEPPGSQPSARGVRDLRDDPRRAELIRRMAQEKAEKRRQQREQNG